jgi:hypothetical protein
MSTKIVIFGNPGKRISGSDIKLEVDGSFVDGEISLVLNAIHGEVATATIIMSLPEIEYRPEKNNV